MNRRSVFVFAAIALPLALSACGNKGPLVLTGDPPAAPVVEMPAPAADTATPATDLPVDTPTDAAAPPPPADGAPAR